jgi:hypothetical protein
MKLCSIAWFVLFFSIVGIIVDYSLFGTTSLGILSNVIFTGLFVWWANWACFKQGYNWMAWLIVLFIVPEIIIIFIFIIPVPIPLRRLILIFVPPFLALTITGVLPFMLFFFWAPIVGTMALYGIVAYVIYEYIKLIYDVLHQIFPYDPNNNFIELFENPIVNEGVNTGNDLSNKVLTSINSKNSSIYVYDPSSVDDNMNNYYSNVFKLIKVQTNNCILGNTIDAEQSNSINNTIGLNKCKVNEIFNIFNLNYSMNQNLIKSQIKP